MFLGMRIVVGLVLVASVTSVADAREWTDVTGTYTIEADLIGFDDESVILQRANKELGSFPIAKLSKKDLAYLKSKQATEAHANHLDKMQTWTTKKGLKLIGKIVDYAHREISLQRRRGNTYVDNTVFGNLPEFYQSMLPDVVEHFESIKLKDKVDLEVWVRSLRGQSRTYHLDGVVLQLENGDEYGVPFFLFTEKDQQILKPGWEAWQADHGDFEKSDDHAFRLQSMAAAYHEDQHINQQIAIMNLNLQAINAGLTSAWEVTLYPGPGNNYQPRWVIMLARDSLTATDLALRQNPGFYAGPVRRVSR